MTYVRHGISVGIERIDKEFFLLIRAVGKLQHSDYEIITPMINSALKGVGNPKIKALIDGRKLEGWEARAAWDDFKLGLEHGRKFVRAAVVGNSQWQNLAARLGSWLIAGEVEYFEDRDKAYQWLKE